MTAYQKSELLVAGRGLLIIVAVLLVGLFIACVRDYNDRRKLRDRYPGSTDAYTNKSFAEILSEKFVNLVSLIGFSLGAGFAFGAFGVFMIFVGFPLILLVLGLLSFIVPYPTYR